MVLESIRKNFDIINQNNHLEVICPNCNKLFTINNSQRCKIRRYERAAIYCSKDCSTKNKEKYKYLGVNALKFYCGYCDKNYIPIKQIDNKITFCSIVCFTKHKTRLEKNTINIKHLCPCTRFKDSRSNLCPSCQAIKIWYKINNTTLQELYEQNLKVSLNEYKVKIRMHARNWLKYKNIPPDCKICGFNDVIEVCHIKSVASFSLDAKLKEVNSIDNLVYLCPNHHALLDNNIRPELFSSLLNKKC